MKRVFESSLFMKIAKVADFFIMSTLWLFLSLPVITFVPASAALYYTAVKVCRYNASDSTIKSFFHSFKENLKQGTLLSLLYVLAAIILYTFFDVARGVGFETLFGKVYIVLLVVYGTVLIQLSLHLIPLLSRFQMKIPHLIKLSFILLKKDYLKIIPYTLTVFGIVVFCYLVPPLTLVLPGGFVYSLSFLIEKKIKAYLRENPDLSPEQPYWLSEEEGDHEE